jgi:sugar lactone lactonase YvrE
MVYDARSKSLLAVSGSSIVAIDAASGAVRTLIAQGLDSPRKIALDAGGNIFISTRGAQMQVRVYNAAGKYLRSVGKAGGRPAVGKFDVNGMFDPEGISVDARGQLWVAENDETPKRISLWNARAGSTSAISGAPRLMLR